MARITKPLTDTQIRNAQSKDKEYKLFDGGGLYLSVFSDGAKRWRLKYLIGGKEKRIAIGVYPSTSLADARAKRDQLKDAIKNGIDPAQERKESKQTVIEDLKEQEHTNASQFHKIAYGWIETVESADITRKKRISYFERDVFPFLCTYDQNHKIISSKQISEIKHNEILTILKERERTSRETAGKIYRDCNRIWFYAISHGYCENNIIANISIRDSLKPQQKRHRPSITDEKILGDLLRAIENYSGGIIMRALLKFVSMIPLRAGNLVAMKWSQIDFEARTLTIPRKEMKVKDPNIPDFVVPLPEQVIEVLTELHKFTGWGVWVFHGSQNAKNHVNPESPNSALEKMGFSDELNGRKQSINSFRQTFRSLIETHSDKHKADFITMERCLDHHEENGVVRAYNHKANYLERMRPLFQWWADYLDSLKLNN